MPFSAIKINATYAFTTYPFFSSVTVGISASGQDVALEHKFISFLLYTGKN